MNSKNTSSEVKAPRARLTTTGHVRQYLADCMLALGQGEMKVDQVAVIVKGAGEINKMLYGEIRVGEMVRKNGDEPPKMGARSIGDPGDDDSKK